MDHKSDIYITVIENCHDEQTLGPYASWDAAYQAGEEICEGVEDRWYHAHRGSVAPERTNCKETIAWLERNHQ